MPYEELKLIDAEEIFYGTYNHPPMMIDGILPAGLTMFSGDSKIGKSWLVLWLCLKLAGGEPIWGVPVKKRFVIYLALEDREQRIQDRMHQLIDVPPSNLKFSFSCGVIGKELEDQIRGALKKYPDINVMFIDTLQLVRENTSGAVNAYSKDYQDLSALKRIADDAGIGIVLVHHTKKEKGKDPFSNSNGSTALQGAPDTSWSLSKDNRFGDTATLSVTGRDVETMQIRLKLNGVIWECLEILDQAAIRRRQIPEWIFKVPESILSDGWFHGTMTDLLTRLQITDMSPSKASKELAKFAADVLTPLDMEILNLRRSEGRYYMIRIKAGDASDAHDANWRREKLASLKGDVIPAGEEPDSSDAAAPLPETPSLPSQPSPDSQPDQVGDDGFRDITPEDDVPFELDTDSGST